MEALALQGYRARAPVQSTLRQWQVSFPFGYASNCSERHAAFVSGLGTFGLCDGSITPKDKALRARHCREPDYAYDETLRGSPGLWSFLFEENLQKVHLTLTGRCPHREGSRQRETQGLPLRYIVSPVRAKGRLCRLRLWLLPDGGPL